MTTVETQRTLKFTRMCKHFRTKRCFMGNNCNFAHSEEELRVRPNLEGTGLCYQFMSKGHCKRGADCTFAHGKKELREIPEDVQKHRDFEANELRKKPRKPQRSTIQPEAALPALLGPSAMPLGAMAPLPMTLPLMPIDDLMLSAGLAMPFRPPPGLPPPPAPAVLPSLLQAMAVATAEKLAALPAMDGSPTTASLRSWSEGFSESDEERYHLGDLQDIKVSHPAFGDDLGVLRL